MAGEHSHLTPCVLPVEGTAVPDVLHDLGVCAESGISVQVTFPERPEREPRSTKGDHSEVIHALLFASLRWPATGG
jgi:hypothetical protein